MVSPDVLRVRKGGDHLGSKRYNVCLLESVSYGIILCDAVVTWRSTIRSGGDADGHSIIRYRHRKVMTDLPDQEVVNIGCLK